MSSLTGPTRRDPPGTVAKKPGTPGRPRISRKTIAQGMSDRFDVPVVTNACAFYTARAAAGALRIRHSLRPPYPGRHEVRQSSGALAPREGKPLRPESSLGS